MRFEFAAMNKSIFFVILLFLFSQPAFAQSGNSDRCEVASVDIKTRRTARLGTFTTVIAEEELTTKAFRLPRTNLFIIAGVFYTDESMASEKGADSVLLELALSRKGKRDVLRSLSWAEAEMPLDGFDVGRVTMLVKLNGRTQLVRMECKKDVRR
jgi:hypothetical protein